jgi:hypothetical protein
MCHRPFLLLPLLFVTLGGLASSNTFSSGAKQQTSPKSSPTSGGGQQAVETHRAGLDVPNLVVGIKPSDAQMAKCEKAVARAKQLKNIDDETDTGIQKCKHAIQQVKDELAEAQAGIEAATRRSVELGDQLADQEVEEKIIFVCNIQPAIQRDACALAERVKQSDRINATFALRVCSFAANAEQQACIQRANEHSGKVQECRAKPLGEQAACMDEDTAILTNRVGSLICTWKETEVSIWTSPGREPIAVLNCDAKVSILAEEGSWYKVQLKDGRVGYLARFMVSEERPNDSPKTK